MRTRFYMAAALVLLAINAWAQPKKNSFLLSFDANYYKNTDTSTIPNGTQKAWDKSLGLSFSAEYFVGERFALGLGLARYWDESEVTTAVADDDMLNLTRMDLESNYWMPKAFVKYYAPLAKRFYLVPHLSLAYGKPKIEALYGTYTTTRPSTGELNLWEPPTTTYTGFLLKPNMLSMEAAPELVYFFHRHWGVSAYFGGLRYVRLSGDSEGSDWTFSFKPKYWRLGVNFNF
ncbi:MAG: outer membrane beta-barrel protein [Mangrovibacterium sp.]